MNRSFAILTLVAATAAAQAATFTYEASLTGPQEVPPNSSPGTGTGTFTLNTDNEAVWIFSGTVSATGLLGQAAFLDFHQAPAGVAGPNVFVPVYPAGSTSLGFTPTTAPTFNPFFALVADTDYNGLTREQIRDNLNAGLFYTDIHTGAFPGGEIRGQLISTTAPVPEPASLATLAVGGLAMLKRRRKA